MRWWWSRTSRRNSATTYLHNLMQVRSFVRTKIRLDRRSIVPGSEVENSRRIRHLLLTFSLSCSVWLYRLFLPQDVSLGFGRSAWCLRLQRYTSPGHIAVNVPTVYHQGRVFESPGRNSSSSHSQYVQDTVAVQPAQFGLPPEQAITNDLNKKYANRVLHDVGLCVCVFDLAEVGEGKVRYGDGCLWYKGW